MKIRPREEMVLITKLRGGTGRLEWPANVVIVPDIDNPTVTTRSVSIKYFNHVGELKMIYIIEPVIAILGPTEQCFVNALKAANGDGRIAYHRMMANRYSWNMCKLNISGEA